MTNTVNKQFKNLVDKTLGKFDAINIQEDMLEQIEKYIEIWTELLDTIVDQANRNIIIAYIAELEKVNVSNDWHDRIDLSDGEESDEWLARNTEILEAVEMCNIDY